MFELGGALPEVLAQIGGQAGVSRRSRQAGANLADLDRGGVTPVVRVPIKVENFLALDREKSGDQALLHAGAQHDGIVLTFFERLLPVHHAW